LVEEIVHSLRMRLNKVDVFCIVIAVSFLNRIEEIEAILKLFIKLHVVDSLHHFFYFGFQLVFLVVSFCVIAIAAAC